MEIKNYSNIFDLNSKGFVVTGGAGYLGSKIVEALVDFGGRVVIAEIADKKIESFIPGSKIKNVKLIECDLDSIDSVKSMFSEAEVWLGSINGLFNMAAYVSYMGSGDADDMTDETFMTGINGTLGYTYRCSREVVPYMKKNNCGTIINTGSLYAMVGPDFRTYINGYNSPPNYGAGKAAILQLTRHCASQFAKYGIRVNSISPGSFPHPHQQEDKQFMKNLADRTMIGRIGFPEDLLGAAILLASDASVYMTGTNVIVDAGTTAW